MSIDIDALGIDELEALIHHIVERLKFLGSVQAHRNMMAFTIGAKFSFDSTRHARLFGMLVKFNRKTVMVLTEAGQQWKVSPHL